MDIHQFEPLWGSWYLRTKPIGAGSFGTVYRAHETIMGRTNECAVKHFSVPQSDAEMQELQQQLSLSFTQDIDILLQDKVENIVEEYETQCQFNGLPNFVQVHGILIREKKDSDGYDVFIRMELLNSIDTRFKSGSVNEQEVIRLGIDICTALAELQKRNLVHRDIKPQNILVSDDGVYKLSDFGSVRKTNGTATAMTMKGTFDYTAPEVLNGTLADSRVDIYSLGVVMYQLLNNHMLPPARLPGDKLEMKLRDISPALSGIVLKACEYDADKRWKSAEDMLDALRQIGNTKKPHKSTKQNWFIPFIASCAILAVSLGLLISGILNPKPTDEIISDLETKISDLNSQHSAELKTVTDEKDALAAQVQSLTIAADFANMNEDELRKTVDKLSGPLKKIGFEIKETNNQIIDIGKKPENTIASGTWGTCEWWIDQAGTLVITEGTGSNTHGNQPAPWKKKAEAIRTVITTGTVNAPQNCSYLFSDLVNCISMDLSQFNTKSVTSMGNMFYNCANLSSLNLSSFDTSNVTDMHGMFSYCCDLSSLILSSFDTSKVINMFSMFSYCTNLSSVNLRSFNTQLVTDMTAMFSHCENLSSLDLSSFSTGKVTKMVSMFAYCEKLSSINLSSFDTWNVTSMHGMFSYCTSLSSIDLRSFDTRKVGNIDDMFSYCTNLSSLDLRNFNTRKVTNLQHLLSSCEELNTLVLGPDCILFSYSNDLSGTWKSDQSNKLYPGESLLKSHPQGTTATYTKVKE